MRFNRISVSICALAVSLFAAEARAQFFAGNSPQDAGITVEGSAELRAPPDVVEINLRLASKAELTDDAVIKHRDARQRTIDTFNALKIENLKIEERSLSLRPGNSQELWQAAMWGNMPQTNKRTQIEIASSLRTRLVGVGEVPREELMSTIGKLLDAAQDSGAGLGPSDSDLAMAWNWGYRNRGAAIVKFIVSNATELQEKVYQRAVEDARQRAQRLARLNGVKLGPVIAVHEVLGPQMNYNYYWNMGDGEDKDEKDGKNEIVADTFSGALVKVKLMIRFAIDSEKVAAEPKAPEEKKG